MSVFTSKAHILLAFLLTLIAVLYQVELQPGYWKASDFASFSTSSDKLFRFMTNAEMVEKWFLWAPKFREADNRPLGVGKKYKTSYSIPFYGRYDVLFSITAYDPHKLLVIKSESFLKPELTIHFKSMGPEKSEITMSLLIRRFSALYQITAGPLL